MLAFFMQLVWGVVGIAVVMAIWFAVQALVRRRSGCALDQDMLEGHGCGTCDHAGSCRRAKEGQHHGIV